MASIPHRVERPRPRRWPWILAALAVLTPVAVLVTLEIRGTSEPVPWATVDAHGTGLTVKYVGSECRDGASLDVEEHADRVVVTVSERVGLSPCNDVGVLYAFTGSLDEPLGDRDVVDGACLTDEWRGRPACLPADRTQ